MAAGGAALVAILLAAPVRHEVAGLSMAPGLLPGDIVSSGAFPLADRFREPARFERWVVAAADGNALKRIAGLPGERVSIRGGDLVIDGRTILKSPRVLAEMASPLPVPGDLGGPDGLRLDAAEVLDDAAFATEVNRPLWPVRDRGIAAVVRGGTAAARAEVELAGTRITWRLPAAIRTGIIAGALDGHAVAVAWRLPTAGVTRHDALPPAAPGRWSHAAPWPDAGPKDEAPAVAFIVRDDHGAVVERCTVWRDVLERPAADGRDEWRLGEGEYLALGDFPTGSVDSRQWGPLGRDRLRHRVWPAGAAAR